MRARVVAPLVAAILGIGGGVATALVVPGDDPAAPSTYNDPLHLDIALVDQECSGASLLVVGYGDSVAPLGTAASENKDDGARYLRTDSSCDTIMGPEDAATPKYAVYLGPFDTLGAACSERMTPEHRADFVTVLSGGNEQLVKCPCVLKPSAAPELDPLMGDPTPEETVWIRSLQSMLNDYDPKKFPRTSITGRYDEATVQRVTEIQHEQSGTTVQDGYVDAATWQILTDRICRIYTY